MTLLPMKLLQFYRNSVVKIRKRTSITCIFSQRRTTCITNSQPKICNQCSLVNHQVLKPTGHRVLTCASRYISCTGYSSKQPEKGLKEEEFAVFYSFPHMRLVRLLSRMKIYQTIFTVILVPCLGVMYSMGSSTLSQVAMSTGGALFACTMLYVMSTACMRVAGFMSLGEAGQTVRVSHLNFWGKRTESYIPQEEIVALGDTPDKTTDIYLKLIQHDSKDVFYYSLKYGIVRDRQMFEQVFGKIM